jgi:hypothetical protein
MLRKNEDGKCDSCVVVENKEGHSSRRRRGVSEDIQEGGNDRRLNGGRKSTYRDMRIEMKKSELF